MFNLPAVVESITRNRKCFCKKVLVDRSCSDVVIVITYEHRYAFEAPKRVDYIVRKFPTCGRIVVHVQR